MCKVYDYERFVLLKQITGDCLCQRVNPYDILLIQSDLPVCISYKFIQGELIQFVGYIKQFPMEAVSPLPL